MWFSGFFVICYLIFLAVMFALIANDSHSVTPYELLYGISPFILCVDFLIRFLVQQTPAKLVRPYTLLPIPKYSCIDFFILSSLFSWGNLIWFAMLLPYSIMSILFSNGIIITLGFLLGWYLLILINNLWYMIMRSLQTENILWWIMAALVYVLIFSPWFIGKNAGINQLMNVYAFIGDNISHFNIFAWLLTIALFALLIYVNQKLQYKLIWFELQNTEKIKLKHVSELSYLNRFGEIGEYLRLEIKSIMRNKNMKSAFIISNALIILFSLLISFTDVYDSTIMTNFFCLYNFTIYGATILIKIMCYEGNYIDCLMVHNENIISLLRAKYYLYSILLIFPLLLMIPTIIMGKCTLLMLISYMIYTAGAQYFVIFQLAIYNRNTISLNSKHSTKNGMENSYMQLIIEILIFTLPLVFINILNSFCGENISYLILLFIGAIFIFTNSLWIHNIYNRMMKRRYVNMESFRSSR
jgi:hypothetical protein